MEMPKSTTEYSLELIEAFDGDTAQALASFMEALKDGKLSTMPISWILRVIRYLDK